MIAQFKFDEPVRIWNLGDVHRGSPNCNVKLLHRVIAEIAGTGNAYWVSTGDLLEVSTRHSVGDVHEAMSVQRETDLLAEELAPICHKCLGFVASNHHRRVVKETGLSLDKAVAAMVGLPYLGITGLLDVTVGRGSHYLCLHHGVGSGTAGNAINRALKTASIFKGCDIYMSGHTHKMGVHPFTQRVVDRKRGLVRSIKSLLVITGHCLDWEESYAESMALEPAPCGFAYVDIYPNSNGREDGKLIRPGFFLDC